MTEICNFNIRKISNGYLLNYTDRRETEKVIFFSSWKKLRSQVQHELETIGRQSKLD